MSSNPFLHLLGAILLGGAIVGGGAVLIHFASDASNPKPMKPNVKVKATPKPEITPRVVPSKKEVFLFKQEPKPAAEEKPEPIVIDRLPKKDLKAEQRELENREWDRISTAHTQKLYEGYLQDHPEGRFVPYAKAALENLKADGDFERLKAVRFGKGVSDAPVYETKTGVHRIVLLTSEGELHPWHFQIPDEWRADSLDKTELVGLIYPPESVLLEVVRYRSQTSPGQEAPSISRFRQMLTVVVVEARTARRRGMMVFQSDPRLTRQTEDYYLTRLEGSVPRTDVEEWLHRHIVTFHYYFDPRIQPANP